MRYTKFALLAFGAGILVGLIVVAFGLDPLVRVASGLMMLGIAAIPAGLLADLWLAIRRRPPPTKRRARVPPRRTAAQARRPARARKPAPRKR